MNPPARVIRAVILAMMLCFCLLVAACSHLNKFSEEFFSDFSSTQENLSEKRIPLPPTTKDFESDTHGADQE